jgi:pyruvate formate lyase activating enzyme
MQQSGRHTVKEALLYEQIGHQMVHCHLCPHECVIPEGRTGFCGVRKNVEGRLYALTYGRVASIAIDPIEKKPLYHFYPGAPTMSVGTYGCNMRCKHCQNWEISHHAATELGEGMTELSPQDMVALTLSRGCDVLAWTYNEPSIWFEYILDAARLAREAGIKTVMVTAGMINTPALKALLTHIDAYRLDVKGFTEEFYQRLTGTPVLKQVLENGITAHRAGAHVEVVTNVIPNWNDTDEQFHGLARWIVENLSTETPWHVTAYHPDNKLTEPPTPVSTLDRAREIGLSSGLRYVYVGNIPGHPAQDTICPGCDSVLIDRQGFGIGANNVVRGSCRFCGYRLGVYRGPEVPLHSNTRGRPIHVL